MFPEYGITGESSYPQSSWVQGGYTETFGAAPQHPCDASLRDGADEDSAPSVTALSCAAQQSKIVIVANLAEYERSSDAMYNTDVVFDATGALVAKYRKLNLWGESYMSVPEAINSFESNLI